MMGSDITVPSSGAVDDGQGLSNDGAGGESQESATLHDVMKPLPNTQSPSGLENPIVKVQLLSRPKESSHSDLNAGFAYAPRVKIIPGQYNRRLPSKPKEFVPEDGVNHFPHTGTLQLASPPPVHQGQQHLPPQDSNKPRTGKINGSAQVLATLDPPRRPPFKDFRLPIQPPIPQEQSYESPVVQYPRPLHHEQENVPHASRTIISIPDKHRTSLPNDLSVSSPHPPRKMPGTISRRAAVVNRPPRDEYQASSRFKTPSSQPRSFSESRSRSNVKKKRSAHRCHERGSSNHEKNSEHEETPSMRPRQTFSPQNELHDKWRRKVNQSMASCAGVLNQNFATLEDEAKEHIKSIRSLERSIKKQQDKLVHFQADALQKDIVIQDLEKERAQLQKQLEESTTELNGRSSRLSKLEEKCRSYKEYLNEAVAEQQTLYKASKEKCDAAISKMYAEEEKRKALHKCELDQVNTSREHLRQVVKATIEEFSLKEQDFKTTISQLNEKVQERDTEVLRERDRLTMMFQQNESIALLQNTVTAFEGQIGQVVKTVNDLAFKQINQDDSSAKEIQAKLDQMTEYLQALDTRTQSPIVLTEKLQEIVDKSATSILGKLNPIMDSHMETKDTLENFSTNLEDKLADLWTAIDEREDLLEELVQQKQHEDAGLAWMLQGDLQVKESELLEQSEQLRIMQQALEQRQGMIDGLRDEIAELERYQAKNMEQSERLGQLRTQHEKLKEEAMAKTALVVELQTQLQESKSTTSSQIQEHTKKIESLQKLIDEQTAKAKAAQIQAVDNVRRETLQEMNQTKNGIENRLNHALEQRATLQRELDAAKAHVSALEKSANCQTQKLALLETELQNIKSADIELREDAEKKDNAHRTVLEEQSECVRNLQAELTIWEKKFDKLTSDARAYDKAAVIVLKSLKQWTQQRTTVSELASEMASARGKDQQTVDNRFKPLMEMFLLQKALMQHCQDQEQTVNAFSRSRQSQLDNANTTGATADLSLVAGLVGSTNLDQGSTTLAQTLLNQARRVTLRSPEELAPHARPPSVHTEQERRRKADPPKSIMKAVPYKISSGILPPNARQQLSQKGDGMQQRINGWRRSDSRDASSGTPKLQPRETLEESIVQGGTMLNHGPYNRPVVRSNSRLNGPVSAKATGSTQVPSSSLEGLEEGGDARLVVADSRKRREAFGQIEDLSRKRAKRAIMAAPTTSTPRPSSPQGIVEDAPTAPRKRNHINVDTQPASPIRISQSSQATHGSQIMAGMFSSKNRRATQQPSCMPSGIQGGKSSHNDSQDPLSLLNQRTHPGSGGQDSQDPITFSQDTLDRSEASLSMTRRFSLMP